MQEARCGKPVRRPDSLAAAAKICLENLSRRTNKMLHIESASRLGHKNSVVVQDHDSGWLQSDPTKTKKLKKRWPVPEDSCHRFKKHERIFSGSAIECSCGDCATVCHCFLRNVTDKKANGKTPMYKPTNAKDDTRIHQFGEKLLDGIIVGCVQRTGGQGRMVW